MSDSDNKQRLIIPNIFPILLISLKSGRNWWIHQMVVWPSQGTSSGWRNGLTGTPGKWKCQTWHPGTNNHMHLHMLQANQQSAPCQCGRKWPGNPDGHQADHEPTLCPCCKEDQKPPWLHQAEHYNRSREVTISLSSALVRYIWVVCPVLGSWVKERHEYTGASPLKNH